MGRLPSRMSRQESPGYTPKETPGKTVKTGRGGLKNQFISGRLVLYNTSRTEHGRRWLRPWPAKTQRGHDPLATMTKHRVTWRVIW